MTVPARVSVVALQVADVARSSAFYQALGWPRSAASRDEIAFFKTAGGLLAVYGAELLEAMEVDLPSGSSNGGRGVILAIHAAAEEVDTALQAAQAAGATVLKPAAQTGAGVYAGFFADPDGHVWEVVHNPNYPLGSEGRYRLP
ncbi:MAG TPA: VOC family protein [Actinomycetes bacterium]|jgi:predicted lactoylglutathione lyase|nr:VOC family protein [Actinomycetes bacterium]